MRELFWKFYEISINYYQGFIQVYFIYKFLQPASRRTAKALCIVFGALLGTTITVLNHITIYEGLASCFYILILFSFALFAFKDNLIKKLLASVIPFVLVLLVTTIELNVISYFYRIPVRIIITDQDIKRFTCLLIIQISIWICLFSVLKSFKYVDEYAFSDWMPIITILSASFILASLLHAISLSIDEDERSYINLAYAVIILLNFIMFHIIQSIFQKNKQINEMKLSKLRERHMEQFVDNANSQYESIRKIRHDIKDQLSTVYDLISKGETQEAMTLIEESSDVVNGIETFVRTNSAVANSIINSKLSVAAALGIKVSCITISDFDGVSELDLCDLLSNALENAITACKNMSPDTNRFIYLEIGKENNIYTFLVKNSVQRSVLSTNPQLKTTKSDKSNHGLGTAIIKDIANKYNGRYDFYETDNAFCCFVMLET